MAMIHRFVAREIAILDCNLKGNPVGVVLVG